MPSDRLPKVSAFQNGDTVDSSRADKPPPAEGTAEASSAIEAAMSQ